MDREKKKVKIEVVNHLERGVDALERLLGLAAFDKLKFEEKLILAQKSCDKLKENSSRSTGDRLSNNVRIKTEKGYAEDCVEHTKMIYEKNQIIVDLNNKVRELENLVFEKDEIVAKMDKQVEELKQKIMAAEMQIMRTDETMNKIRQQKLESDQAVEELRRQLSAYEVHKETSDRTIEEMRRKENESVLYTEELKRQKLEAEHGAEELASKLSKADHSVVELRQSVKKLECLNLMVYKAVEVHKMIFENLVPMAEELANLLRMKVDDLVNVKNKFVAIEGDEGVRPSLGNECKRGEGNTVRSAGKCSTCNSVDSGLPERGAHEQLMTETCETTPSSAAAVEIIEISDCDDETNPGGDANVAETCTNSGKTKTFCEKAASSPSSNQTNKRNGIDCSDFSIRIPETKRSKPGKTWMFGADMLKAFQEDDELCMNAMCALYRQKVSASKSTEGSNRVFYHFETMRGCDLAEYLIDGDPELRLTKSVREVKQQFINQCRRLATDHYASLFMLYCNGDDPFFRST
ncbi:hypothetical protein DH2020_028924 [Rehmannia glutinosa]|uniref:Uncharacterized protein n=1 Tax=Rehmannia glutinosa TaxID=99300 RepID=A0ABR0VU93_REHGL